MIGLDLDGTLLREDKTLSTYSKEVITEAIRRGIIVLVAFLFFQFLLDTVHGPSRLFNICCHRRIIKVPEEFVCRMRKTELHMR